MAFSWKGNDVTHSKKGILVAMCPKTTNLNCVREYTQCYLNEAVIKTVDEDSTISKVMKGLFKTKGATRSW